MNEKVEEEATGVQAKRVTSEMHVLIVRNCSNKYAVDASVMLATYLATQGLSYTLLDSREPRLSLFVDMSLAPAGFNEAVPVDLAVALGGDGTILRTARFTHTSGAPILGLNFGNLGFLANSCDGGVVEFMADALADELVREQRSNLCITVACEGDDEDELSLLSTPGYRMEGEQRSFFALNELVVSRGSKGRVIDFSLDIAGEHVAAMRGDGVIVATATGSTAYALSAGGPLVAPTHSGLVVMPLAPHSLRSRAIVTDQGDIVEIDLSSNSPAREAVLFIDGEHLEFKKRVMKVFIRRGNRPTVLLRRERTGFYRHASEVFFE